MRIITFLSFYLIVFAGFAQQDSLIEVNIKDSVLTTEFEEKKGRLIVPAKSYISLDVCCVEQYNQKLQENSFSTRNPKEEILKVTCKENTQAISVADGKVALVLKTEGAYTVVLKHGKYGAVYSNLESVSVEEGKDLKENQVIGIVKTKSLKTVLNYELYFKANKMKVANWIKLD
ncbi:peptidoglycan DD-metalloendopeptidase family protein [Brumimicrobium mesophilum]|uniref:peptidoglycan DD-metalloendopeptidase family protein n=1 Tax=Brumimicrobium mesophilum TaxID=392717 RepID=UPI000D13EE23|nr:peptidoglycan DD-metalloendopeptidase family protein [Brumimicrobium mesophilum]